MQHTAPITFENTYTSLPDRFYARIAPTPVTAPRLIALNGALAAELGLDADWLASPDGLDMLSGRKLPHGTDPIATAYAGHQFGNFVPQLGDGRAVLLGEVIGRHGQRRDLQLKGAGPTPFSRRGDGRAALGPVLREYIVSEAMAALGIPTTRALAAVLSGERVQRETMLPGAVLTRVASSHIRIGTFQYFAARGDGDAVMRLADHVITRHYPDVATAPQPYLALLEQVIARQAALVARWLNVGFIHGVMNTDNMSICGETIDYGPCAFMDAYDPAMVFSSIDQSGRYAFANQPRIALWNLTRLAECLLPLLAETEEQAIAAAQSALGGFAAAFDVAFHDGMRAKLGLTSAQDADPALFGALLTAMAEARADFTLSFRALCDAVTGDADPLRMLFADPSLIDAWLVQWRERLDQDPGSPEARRATMRAANPAFIPRNHRIEAVIQAAVRHDDFAPFAELTQVLARPFDDQPDHAAYQLPPQPDERVLQTFCGT
ncbi:MAG: YdiU family protein [Tardiphaga sp.]|nr:YdiU family protein [Tardiphaga sp.]